jgi:hypothetical protein
MNEKHIEQKFRTKVKKCGGIAIKFISPGFDGVPDRIVLMPGGRIAFVELKAPGRQLRLIQIKRKRQLEELGFSVYIIDNIDKIGGVLDEIQSS